MNNEEKTVVRAVAYIRVSTKEQAERRQSLKTQEEAIVRFAERNNIQLVKKFTDAGESAKTADRAELINCIKYCGNNKGKIDHLIVFKIDRLARNAVDHQTIIAGLAKFGVTLKSATEALDDTASGKLMGTILSGFAEFDNDIRTERVKTGMMSRAKDGYWVWKAPVGYRSILDEGKRPILVPHREEAEIVNFIFFQFAKGIYKQTEVLEQLKRFEIISSGKLVISTQRLYKILTNKLYIGVIETSMLPEPVRGKHEAIVDDEIFYRCQKLLGLGTTKTITRSRTRDDFPLKGVLRCPECGSTLTASWNSGKSKKYAYYHCHAKKCSKPVNVPESKIQEWFEGLLENMKPQAGAIKLFKRVFMATWKSRFAESTAAVNDAEKKLIELDRCRKI